MKWNFVVLYNWIYFPLNTGKLNERKWSYFWLKSWSLLDTTQLIQVPLSFAFLSILLFRHAWNAWYEVKALYQDKPDHGEKYPPCYHHLCVVPCPLCFHCCWTWFYSSLGISGQCTHVPNPQLWRRFLFPDSHSYFHALLRRLRAPTCFPHTTLLQPGSARLPSLLFTREVPLAFATLWPRHCIEQEASL